MALSEALYSAKTKRFKWNSAIEDDVRNRIRKTIALLGLSDSEDHLFKRFRDENFPQSYLKVMKQRERKKKKNDD
jgi:hypothetical protein